MNSEHAALIAKTKEAFAVYRGLGRQLIDSLIAAVESLSRDLAAVRQEKVGLEHDLSVMRGRLAKTSAQADVDLAIARRECAEMRAVLLEFHRLALIIESAVRNADLPNHAAVLAVIKQGRALAKPEHKEGSNG